MLRVFFAFVAGAASVFGFAPFRVMALPVLGAAVLFHLWSTSATPRSAAGLGFAFGLGLFGAGVSWVSIALHTFGAMPLPIAALATFGFCAYLAAFPALTGWLARMLADRGAVRVEWLAAALWTLTEWARGWVLSGFPWLSLGYSQVPHSPLAGLGPIGGTYAITLALALLAAALARLVGAWAVPATGSDPPRRI